MPNVVLDTDFLSSFLKIEQLDLLRRFFQVENLLLPTAVYREIALGVLLPALTTCDWLEIRAVDQRRLSRLASDQEFSELGAGEQEATTLAASLADSVLLISDRRAGRYARGLGIDVVDIPAFLLAYRRSGAAVESIQELIDALQDKDHYGFSKAVLEKLLD